MRYYPAAALAALLACAPATAQEVCKAQEEALTKVGEEFKTEQEDIQTDAEHLENETPANLRISGQIKFEDTHAAMHLPQVTMKNRKMSFDVPTSTMKERRFVWSVPAIRMENKKIGQYPQFTCNWRGCRTKWRDIITKVPVSYMERKQAITKVPEFKMHRHELITAVPEVKMVRKDMYYKLPHITVADPIPDYGPVEERSKQLGERGEQLSVKMKARSVQLAADLYDCHRENLVQQREQTAQTYEQGISQLNALIEFVRAQGADPKAFQPDEPGEKPIDLVAQRDQMMKDRDMALEEMDKAIAEMVKASEALIVDAPVVA